MGMNQVMHEQCREWIVDVLQGHLSLVKVAIRQRAKFEGWLKFELACYIEQIGDHVVQIETSDSGEIGRSDITFYVDSERYDLELKTPNTNWRVPGVANINRPITQNMAEIVKDASKLQGCSGHGLVAFVLFPVPRNDYRWHGYLDRIANALLIPLSENANCSRMYVPLETTDGCEMIVCCFSYPQDGHKG
jgi:hypothetical protein